MRSAFLIAALAACHSSVVVGDLEEITALRAVNNPDLDILFVVDNSGSMAEQQASLAANFTRMIDVLDQLDGPLPNLHIGVVSSDMGTSALLTPPGPALPGSGGCTGYGDNGALHGGALVTGNFISDVARADGTRATNYTGELRDAFAQIATVGNIGCGFEQHLSAMRAALASNADFLRPEANLAIVIIADEDDCSALDGQLFAPDDTLGQLHSFRCARFGVECDQDMTEPGVKTNCKPSASSAFVSDVQPFVDDLLAAKPDPRNIMVAAIVGPPAPVEVALRPVNSTTGPTLSPSCMFQGPGGPELADPAVRISAFLDAFPGRSQLTSICDADLSGALSQIGESAKKLQGDPCLDAKNLADASPDPGLQPACEVVDIRDSSPSAPLILPACGPGSTTTDCYEIAADPIACPSAPENLRVRLQRANVPTLDTWTHVRCQLAD